MMYMSRTLLCSSCMATFSVADARRDFAAVLARAQDEAVTIERRGEPVAIVFSPEQYDRMSQALDDAEDLAAFDAALAEEGANIDWARARADLGWEWRTASRCARPRCAHFAGATDIAFESATTASSTRSTTTSC